MSQNITLIIDGSTVRTPKGSSVLDAALLYGICIPHLCHMPSNTDVGSCRICVVEHVQNGRSKITTSCSLIAKEGMVINANSEKVVKMRRNIAELLVTQAPNSRAIQDIAVRCGVTETRYPFRNEDCVQCGICVRVCKETYQAQAIGFVGRGPERRVDFPFGVRPDFCKKCWACVDLCPMKVTPCEGPMKTGEEYLCGKCESTIKQTPYAVGSCTQCEMGEGFSCERSAR